MPEGITVGSTRVLDELRDKLNVIVNHLHNDLAQVVNKKPN